VSLNTPQRERKRMARLLIDDIRIREFLLTSLDKRVADLMDRRFVALKANDNQKAVVDIFKQYDRTALPVTDSAGVLIGIDLFAPYGLVLL
jgi:magnesium transporter